MHLNGNNVHESSLISVFNMLIDKLDNLSQDVVVMKSKMDSLFIEKELEVLCSVDIPFAGHWIDPSFDFQISKDFVDIHEPKEMKVIIHCKSNLDSIVLNSLQSAVRESQTVQDNSFASVLRSICNEKFSPSQRESLAKLTMLDSDEHSLPEHYGIKECPCLHIIDYLVNQAIVRKFKSSHQVYAGYQSGNYLQLLFNEPLTIKEAIKRSVHVVQYMSQPVKIHLMSLHNIKMWGNIDIECLYLISRVNKQVFSDLVRMYISNAELEQNMQGH